MLVVALVVTLLVPGPSYPVQERSDAHARMVTRLAEIAATEPLNAELFVQAEQLRAALAALGDDAPLEDRALITGTLGKTELEIGNIGAATRAFEMVLALLPQLPPAARSQYAVLSFFLLGVTRLREAQNRGCVEAMAPASCILPVTPGDRLPAAWLRSAYGPFAEIIRNTPAAAPIHIAALWLLNLAAELAGDFPANLADDLRLPDATFAAETSFPRFAEVAGSLGVATLGHAGGVVAEDLDGDGLLDLMTSDSDPAIDLRVFRNSGGQFEDVSATSGLAGIRGGFNLVHADYDNDGDADVLVLRGGWRTSTPHWENSLLRNDGDLRFRDVTFSAGLEHTASPTQTAAWSDFDNDGDLDLYVGNETRAGYPWPSNLYRNEGDGTFVDVASASGVTNDRFAKSVVWGDFDGDGFADLYVSNMGHPNRLYRNNRDGTFTDVAPELGVARPIDSYVAWFWDVNNDGYLDIFCNAYSNQTRGATPPLWHVAASRLDLPHSVEPPRLYLGQPGGRFVEVVETWGLSASTLPMGANFGDLDNDGWLDFYLGTGYPPYEAMMPNVMYRNRAGTGFEEVTFAGGFGHLAKGHGIAFADLDNDGDQDVFAQMGGMLPEDRYFDALYENPGFGNRWVTLRLVGTQTNRSAIGARVHVTVETPAGSRSLYRTIGTGGSFGSDPLRAEIGLGDAERIVSVDVFWPVTGATERFAGVQLDSSWVLTEGSAAARRLDTLPVRWGSSVDRPE